MEKRNILKESMKDPKLIASGALTAGLLTAAALVGTQPQVVQTVQAAPCVCESSEVNPALTKAAETLMLGAVKTIYWSDGDSGKINGFKFRLEGIDSPETGGVGAIGGARCEEERVLGFKAKQVAVDSTKGKLMYITKIHGIDKNNRFVIDLAVAGVDSKDLFIPQGYHDYWNYAKRYPKPVWCK